MEEESEEKLLEEAGVTTLRQARMLDLRSYIGALFFIFGVVCLVSGIFASQAAIDKAGGININIWAGIAMLLLSGFMGVWAFVVPPEVPAPSGKTLPEPQD